MPVPGFKLGDLFGAVEAEPEGDPYFSNVILLMGFDDVGTPSTMHDESLYNQTTHRSGVAVNTTEEVKVGTGSLGGMVDGLDDYAYAMNSEDFYMEDEDFTIEAFIFPTSIPTSGDYMGIVCKRWATGDEAFTTLLNGDLGGKFSGIIKLTDPSSSKSCSSLTAPDVGEWSHVAFIRNGSYIQAFLDGVGGATTAVTGNMYENAWEVMIGMLSLHSTQHGFHGYIDEVRITRGVCRYTEDFSPPTTKFPRGE